MICIFIGRINNKNKLITPNNIFQVGFLISVLYAILYYPTVKTELCFETVIVLCLGSISFTITTCFLEAVFLKKNRYKNFVSQEIQMRNIKTSILFIFLIFQTLIFILVVLMIKRMTGETSLLLATYYFRQYRFDGIIKNIPSIISLSRQFCMAAGYIWGYLLVSAFVYRNDNIKNIIILAINLVISFLMGLLYGTRGDSLQLFVAVVFMYFIIYGIKSNWKKKLSKKSKRKVYFIIISVFVLFPIIGNFSRVKIQTTDYWMNIYIYLSAPLDNLNSYITSADMSSFHKANQTFVMLINSIGNRVNFTNWIYSADLPYLYKNGLSMGNVYTTYYPFYYDCGFVGVILFTILMAIISEISYLKCLKIKSNCLSRDIPIIILIFAYIASSLVFSFFCNRFYDFIFTNTIIRYIIMWLLLRWLLLKVDVKIKM